MAPAFERISERLMDYRARRWTPGGNAAPGSRLCLPAAGADSNGGEPGRAPEIFPEWQAAVPGQPKKTVRPRSPKAPADGGKTLKARL